MLEFAVLMVRVSVDYERVKTGAAIGAVVGFEFTHFCTDNL
jgi:hypothetical protein